MKKMIIALLAISSAVGANELDNLIDSSSAIVDQINKGILMVGAASQYAYQGDALSDGSVSASAHISSEQLEAYNNALSGMSDYLPFGSVQQILEEEAQVELNLMETAIEQFAETTVQIISVQEVAEKAETASSPQEEADVQTFVADNIELLTIEQSDVDTYNQSLDDIETHANNASAYLAVAGNQDAVDFLQQGAENNNTRADLATLSYSANNQWVKMSWSGTSNATAVFLNGQNFGLDLYVTESDILTAGSESEFYLSGPTAQGYNCFMYGTDCSYESIGN